MSCSEQSAACSTSKMRREQQNTKAEHKVEQSSRSVSLGVDGLCFANLVPHLKRNICATFRVLLALFDTLGTFGLCWVLVGTSAYLYWSILLIRLDSFHKGSELQKVKKALKKVNYFFSSSKKYFAQKSAQSPLLVLASWQRSKA